MSNQSQVLFVAAASSPTSVTLPHPTSRILAEMAAGQEDATTLPDLDQGRRSEGRSLVCGKSTRSSLQTPTEPPSPDPASSSSSRRQACSERHQCSPSLTPRNATLPPTSQQPEAQARQRLVRRTPAHVRRLEADTYAYSIGTRYCVRRARSHRRTEDRWCTSVHSTVSWASACILPMRCGACRQRQQAETADGMLHVACLRTWSKLRFSPTQESSSAASLSGLPRSTE